MMNFIKLTTTALLVFCVSLLAAQTGTIRGTVYDGANGEPFPFANVIIVGSTTGTATDFDGAFELSVAPGTYDLEFSFLSYQTMTITGVEVTAGEVSLLDNIQMQEETEILEEVVVTAKQIRNTEAALMTIQRKSPNLLDGISSQTFRKIGDSDAADAVKRVTGVSVEGGKYVYVRGLGDRYTKTMLNNVDIPGLDPDRNSLQIDIFPTNLIDNMFVLKSAVADMPADFTGGVVNLETKDFPEEKVFNISGSIGYNPSMHFNGDYLTYDGGATDWLGYDDGTRSLPNGARANPIPSPLSGDSDTKVSGFLNEFDSNLGAVKETSLLDYSFGFSLADQIKLAGPTSNKALGYIVSATYKNSTDFLDDLQYGDYQVNQNGKELVDATTLSGSRGTSNVLLGGLAGLAYKTENSKFKLTAMHLQNGESSASAFDVNDNSAAIGRSGYVSMANNLEYSQRSLTNVLLNGKHYLGEEQSWTIDWRVSPTFSHIEDPDIRNTEFTTDNRPTFAAGAGGNPTRLWRYLDEVNVVGRLDITKELSIADRDAKIKFGASQVSKERDYEILQYTIQFFGSQPRWTGTDFNSVLTSSNIYPTGTIYYSSGNKVPNPNEYNATVSNTAGYVSLEFAPTEKLKAVLGLRGENFVQKHTGRDIQDRFVLDDAEVLNSFDLFPSSNFIYSLNDEQNLRVSYSRTIARPSFKELSFAQILDPISGRTFNGGLFPYPDWDGNLHETYINNFDLRWELFASRAQMVSVSAFYKGFNDPIELVRIQAQPAAVEYQPRNVGDGQVFGLELEFRKKLDFLATTEDGVAPFELSGNVTWASSSIEMTDQEFQARKNFEKPGETVDGNRVMAGQAPYIINAGISYKDPNGGFDGGLFYNVKGATLIVVGGGLFPDVYSDPFHSLNFNVNKNLGDKLSLNFKVSNLLGDIRQESFTGYEAANQIYTRYSPGTEFGLGLKYSIY